MEHIKKYSVLGVLSSTSFDGVGIALLQTDGVDLYDIGSSYLVPYDEDLLNKIKQIQGKKPDCEQNKNLIQEVEIKMTEFCASLIKDFLLANSEQIDVIAFGGHTIFHDPANRYTHQIGCGKLLASLTGIRTVSNFRKADILAGGQGAPFSPIYYSALISDEKKPVVVVDVGAVSAVSCFGEYGEMIGFVSGPGNAVIDNWVTKKTGQYMDYNGKLAIMGRVDEQILKILMSHKYFAKHPPKACDKSLFDEKMQHLDGLSVEDGAATATAFVAESIAYSISFYLPEYPHKIILCGGGSKNPTLVRFIKQRLGKYELETAIEKGWFVDTIDAQVTAFLAARRLNHLPTSFPATTGVAQPIIGGEVFEP